MASNIAIQGKQATTAALSLIKRVKGVRLVMNRCRKVHSIGCRDRSFSILGILGLVVLTYFAR